MELSVGRRNKTVSASGISTPSLNTSRVKMHLSSPSRSAATARLRVAVGVFPTTASEGRPASVNAFAIYSACSTLAQSPSARIRCGSWM